MKLVVNIAPIAAHQPEYGQKFVRAAAELVRDGHSLMVIHGGHPALQSCCVVNGNGNGANSGPAPSAEFASIERENRVLVSLLAEASVAAIGLRATDAGLLQLRKQNVVNGATAIRVEAARLHPRWLEIICANKGVPVVSNLSCWGGGEDYLIDVDRMAAVCAADWNADALIYITEERGVPGPEGGILRWFDINANHSPQAETLSNEMRGHLEACATALRRGVRRARILPLSNVECLSSFYFSSISYGTEVIAGAAATERAMAALLRR